MENVFNHPLFLSVFAVACAGGVIIVMLISKLKGNGNSMPWIQLERLERMEEKIDSIIEFQKNCRLEQYKMFATKEELNRLQEQFNRHSHTTDGRVVR